MAGAFLTCFGMMMTSIATEYYQFFLAQGVVVGLGAGCLFVPSVAIVAQWFSTKRALATGITAAGGSVGGVLYPIIFRRLEPQLGFGWATRIIGFISLATLIFSLAVVKPRVKPSGHARAFFDGSAFHNRAFVGFCIGAFLFFLGLYLPFFYISVWASQNLNVNRDFSFYLLSVTNAASVFGRIIPGLIADRLGSINTMLPCLLMCATLAFSWISVDSVWKLVLFCVAYGFFSGACVSLPGTIVVGICPQLSKVGTWMGMSFVFAGFGLLVGNPIAGAIITHSPNDSFVGAQCYGGATILVGSVMFIWVRWLRHRDGIGWKV
jgi:MFS family permease